MESSLIGKTLAQFEVLDLLGEGGMGTVYRAVDTKLGREVAIKVLPETFVADPERLARFEREARVLASLDHPRIAAIYEVGEHDGVHFLAMQLAPGDDLSDWQKRGRLPLKTTLTIALQIASALEAAHEQGIVHRDLKPANVKVKSDGNSSTEVKVLDFGLAKAWDEDGPGGSVDLSMSPTLTAQMTRIGVILGTAGYMSPEQARGHAADARSDIWAFGVLLWELLAGKQLFQENTVSDTLAAVLKTEIDLTELPDDLPRPIRNLVARCLERDVRRRLQAIGEARISIENYLEDPDAGFETTAPTAEVPRTNNRSRRLTAILGTAILAAASGALVAWKFGGEPAMQPTRRFEIPVNEARVSWTMRPELSPDGGSIAYSGAQLLIRPLAQLTPRSLEGTKGARAAAWSPDSAHLVFQGEDRRIYRSDVARGGRRIIAESPERTPIIDFQWFSDDSIVFALWRKDVYRVPASGGEPTVLVDLDENVEIDAHSIVELPGSRAFVLTIHYESDEKMEWMTVAFRDGERYAIGKDMYTWAYSKEGYLLYNHGFESTVWAVPFDVDALAIAGEPFVVATDARAPTVAADGSLLYEFALPDEGQEIARVDPEGNVVETYGDILNNLEGPSLSPDGGRIVAEYQPDGENVNNIGIFDLERSVWTRLTNDEIDQGHPRWSADGRRVFFRDGHNVSTIRSDGVGGKTVLFPGQDPDPSPDGAWLLFRHEQTMKGIRLDEHGLPTGDAEPMPATAAGDAHRGAISPDGRFIAYGSNQSGQGEVYVTEFPDSQSRWQVSVNGGFSPKWRADGGAIYYSYSNTEFMVDFEVIGEGPKLGSPVALFSGETFNGRTGNGVFPADNGGSFLVVRSTGDLQSDSQMFVLVQNWLTEIASTR